RQASANLAESGAGGLYVGRVLSRAGIHCGYERAAADPAAGAEGAGARPAPLSLPHRQPGAGPLHDPGGRGPHAPAALPLPGEGQAALHHDAQVQVLPRDQPLVRATGGFRFGSRPLVAASRRSRTPYPNPYPNPVQPPPIAASSTAAARCFNSGPTWAY